MVYLLYLLLIKAIKPRSFEARVEISLERNAAFAVMRMWVFARLCVIQRACACGVACLWACVSVSVCVCVCQEQSANNTCEEKKDASMESTLESAIFD